MDSNSGNDNVAPMLLRNVRLRVVNSILLLADLELVPDRLHRPNWGADRCFAHLQQRAVLQGKLTRVEVHDSLFGLSLHDNAIHQGFHCIIVAVSRCSELQFAWTGFAFPDGVMKVIPLRLSDHCRM